MKNYYGALSNKISEREKKNAHLARVAAREGFVLLKNDGALPLKNKKIALYGMGARKTVKGGTGSGAVQERYSVSIEEGLINAGYIITSGKYLDDYDVAYEEAYRTWKRGIDEKTGHMPFEEALGMLSILGGFQWPAGRCITKEDIELSDTDTAIYVLARQAGEGSDRRYEEGDWFLSKEEKANLTLVASAYKHTIVVVNVGGQIDLSFMDEIDGIDALVFFAQGGMEGGNALADVLSGKYSFCGKLADTWAKRYEDIPYALEYSYLNNDLENEYYREGIYVGYRYFDTYGIEPRYPFGFGLSYTDFSISVKNVEVSGTEIIIDVEVKNIGNQYSGKEVVQIYVSSPILGVHKEYQKLVGFAKTKELAPNQMQTVRLLINMEDAAYYNENESAWMLDQGDYILRVGNSSRNTFPAAILKLPESVKTAQCKRLCAPKRLLKEIEESKLKIEVPTDVERYILDPEAFNTIHFDYTKPSVIETEEEAKLLDSFTTEELVSLVKGGDLRAHDPEIFGALGTVGRTSLELMTKGVGNIVFCDGPAGLNLVEHVIVDGQGIEKPTKIPEKYNFGDFSKKAKHLIGTEGVHVYRYATAWPVEILLAQTWDIEIMEQVGKGMGAELEEFGVTLLLAPGMNIHRNPLCGRNFEYFSEDPFLTGKLAAAQVKGTQSFEGIGLTVKHFCCNNQEDNRTGVSANINERALREIYLKGFEIVVRESQPLALMSSYNRLNGIYTPNSCDLLTNILRCEWGFEGVVMTDWNSCSPGQGDPAKCVPAGNDLVMPGTNLDRDLILEAVNKGKISMDDLRRSACRVLKLILNSQIYKDK